MVRMLGIDWAPMKVSLERRLQTLTAGTWFVSLGLGGMTCGAIAFYLFMFTHWSWFISLYLVWIIIDIDTCETGGRSSKWVRNWKCWTYLRDFFPVKLERLKDSNIVPGKNYLFCVFPHGVLSTGVFCNFGTDVTGFRELFPNIEPHPVTLKAHFYMPIFREYISALGACACSSRSINYILSHPDKNKAAILVVGGAAESLYCRPGVYKIILNRRKGFIKLALRNGTPLVPVFSFGETDIFNQVNNPDGSWLKRFQDHFRHLFGIAPVLPIGRGFFQYSFGLVPKRRPITTIVGKPIEIPRIHEPTNEDIEKYHKLFAEELNKLFEENKHKYVENPEKTVLEIL